MGFRDAFEGKPISYPDNPPYYGPAEKVHWTGKYQTEDSMLLFWNRNDPDTPPNYKHPRIRVPCNPEVMALSPVGVEFHAILLGGPGDYPELESPLTVEARISGAGTLYGPILLTILPSLTQYTPLDGYTRTRSVMATVRVTFSQWALGPGVVESIDMLDLSLRYTESPAGGLLIGGFRAVFTT